MFKTSRSKETNQMNGDTLNNVKCEDRTHFKHKMREHLRDKINKLETNSKNKNIRKPYFSGYRIQAKLNDIIRRM
jgi:hypothetical protein